MAKKENSIPPDRLALYEALIARTPEIERKCAKVPYTSVNGHMFTFLSGDGSMALRLPKGEREQFIDRYNTKLHRSYGAVMKEYVTVPDNLLDDTDALKPYLDVSYESVKSLEPKPTKRNK